VGARQECVGAVFLYLWRVEGKWRLVLVFE